MKEFLDSDRVNYLVWRYLLEGNYREAAAKFQKEWHIHEPHRHFDFARHVKSRALVSVVNKGLCYHALEREHARKLASPAASAAASGALQLGIFGPLITHPPPHKVETDEDEEEHDAAINEAEISRKRQLDSRPQQHPQLNGSPAKRPKLSNGYENGLADAVTTPMELDGSNHLEREQQQQQQQQPPPPLPPPTGDSENNNAYPSPMEAEQQQAATPPATHTEGPEQGTQVEKVDELATETTFLRMMPCDAPDGSASPSSPNPARGENAPILLRCEWNPKDPSSLAAAGTDALARVWTVSRATTAPQAGDPITDHVNGVNHPFQNLVDEGTPRSATVCQMAWNSSGTSIAVAVDYDGKASIQVWGKDGSPAEKFDLPEPPVIKLRWNPADNALLAVTPENDGALVSVHERESSNPITYFLAGHDLLSWPLDAAWTSDTTFLLCGGDVMLALRCTPGGIVVDHKLETRPDDQLLQVRFDERSQIAATSSARGAIDLWDDAGHRKSISAHSGTITSIQWQPLPAGAQAPDDERLIASGGDDGAILVWNARRPETKAKYAVAMDGPVVALAFTPDGAFIAGATAGRILIWKVGESTVPRASWSRSPHPGWLSPKTNSETEEEDEHCLGWDCDGQRLAYGTNSRLAVINFRRT